MVDVKPSSFTRVRTPLDLRFRRAHLASREWITPDYVRLRVQGEELAGFDSPGADDHIRLFFPDRVPESVEELRAAPSREYTPLAWGDDWLDIEFLVHGDEGIAGRWAATAEPGDPVGVGGPRGSLVFDGVADAWFLAGDETAVPAIRRFCDLMPDRATGSIVIEVEDPAHEIPLKTPSGVELTVLHRLGRRAGVPLAEALGVLGSDQRPAGSVFGFVAAEQAIVKPGRALLLERWGLPAEHVTVKGYWKRGEAEYHAPH